MANDVEVSLHNAANDDDADPRLGGFAFADGADTLVDAALDFLELDGIDDPQATNRAVCTCGGNITDPTVAAAAVTARDSDDDTC